MDEANMTPSPIFKTKVEQVAGVSSPCYQCNRCTAGCPMVFAMDLTPAQFVHALRLGEEEKVLHSDAIWVEEVPGCSLTLQSPRKRLSILNLADLLSRLLGPLYLISYYGVKR